MATSAPPAGRWPRPRPAGGPGTGAATGPGSPSRGCGASSTGAWARWCRGRAAPRATASTHGTLGWQLHRYTRKGSLTRTLLPCFSCCRREYRPWSLEGASRRVGGLAPERTRGRCPGGAPDRLTDLGAGPWSATPLAPTRRGARHLVTRSGPLLQSPISTWHTARRLRATIGSRLGSGRWHSARARPAGPSSSGRSAVAPPGRRPRRAGRRPDRVPRCSGEAANRPPRGSARRQGRAGYPPLAARAGHCRRVVGPSPGHLHAVRRSTLPMDGGRANDMAD
jgi:hypothetical protein